MCTLQNGLLTLFQCTARPLYFFPHFFRFKNLTSIPMSCMDKVTLKPVRLRHMPNEVSSYFNYFPRYLGIFSRDFTIPQQFLVEHDDFDPTSGSCIPDFITLSY